MLPPDPKKMLPNKADTTPDHLGPLQEAETGTSPLGPPAAVSAPPSLGTMVHAFRHCALWAVPLAAILGVVAGVASLYLYPGTYSSSIVFRIKVRAAHGSQEDEGHFSNVQKAYVARLLSHEILSETIQKSEVAEKYGVNYTSQSLAKLLRPSFLQGPETMNVAVSGENPEVLAAILTALGEVYPTRMEAEEEARVKERIRQLKRRLDIEGDRRDPSRPLNLAERLRDKRIELGKAEKDAGLDAGTTVKSKQDFAQQMKANAQRELTIRKQELQGAEAKLGVRRRARIRVSEVDVQDALSRNENYKEANQAIRDLRIRIDKKKDMFRGKALERETAADRESLRNWIERRNDIVEEIRSSLEATLQKKADDEARREREKEEGRKAQLTAQVRGLEIELQQWTREVEELRTNGVKVPPEVEALRDQVKQLEKEQDAIGGEVSKLEASLPLPTRLSRESEAFVPQERDTSRSQKIAIAVGLLTFMGVVVGLCLLEARGKRVYSSTDLQQGLGLRIIGSLPRLPASARKKSAVAQVAGGYDVRSGLNEAVDSIRTVLMNSPRNDGARVILVTSALGGEGKTSLASHLAASLARAWRKTLLIDGDLRKPALHGQFEVPLEPGLSEALRGEIEFDDTVKPTMTSRLWLMPAGKVDGHSLQALAQEGLDNVFELLKEQYDFIVIDTSPVLLVPDGMLLAKQADSVLLSVMKDHSRIPAVYAAQQKLESLGIRVLGSVVIGEKTESYGHAVAYPRQG